MEWFFLIVLRILFTFKNLTISLFNIFVLTVYNRGLLFKINDVVSKQFIKISNGNITNTLLFFVEKKRESFAMQRILTFFSTKNNSVFAYVVGIYLTR